MRNTKKVKDLQPGDVIRVEWGDYDNFVTVTVDKAERCDDGLYQVDFHTKAIKCNFVSSPESLVEVIECAESAKGKIFRKNDGCNEDC